MASDVAPAAYRFDARVRELLAAVAGVLADGARRPGGPDFAAVLLALEDLHVAAEYTAAGVTGDQPALCDPAGVAAVGTMWEAFIDELGAAHWEELVASWRAGAE